MKKSEFTEEQIAFVLHRDVLNTNIYEVCTNIGISQAAFYALEEIWCHGCI
jgi:hypothetical protein